MRLTVLSVAFPFAPVTADPTGGAEQVLAQLDRALVAAGHRSIVIAPKPSSVAGELLSLPALPRLIDEIAKGAVHAELRGVIGRALRREKIDLLHLHGVDFHDYLPPPGPRVLVTLHLPLAWYAETVLRTGRPLTWLQPVSASQAALAPHGVRLSPAVGNGVACLETARRKRRYALALGRICPEKGFEDALDAARSASSDLLLAGAVYPYQSHRSYFASEIAPRLDRKRRWLGPVVGAQKHRLLAEARCLLVPSRVPETSSLVAMEALAAGTPVVAYPAGALADLVEHGRTGFLVSNPKEMAAAISEAGSLDPELCRRRAREAFPLERMTSAYLERYAEIVGA